MALLVQLATLCRKYKLEIRYDRQLMPGAPFSDEIDRYLAISDIVLLLISPDFLASEYCRREMRRALTRHATGRAHVVPVILRHCYWQTTPIEHLSVLPMGGKPVTAWTFQDEALLDVAQGVRRAVEDILKIRSSRKRVRGALPVPAKRRKA